MWGISYGGFTAIQVAMLRPPHLAAIVPMMASDDRYTDDIHYLGGCMTVSELGQYAVSMVGMNAMPPLTGSRDPGWVDAWRDRLERTPVWLFEWLRQQRDGPYWRQGSLAPDWDRLVTPVFLIGGWMDEYVDAALRMLERCTNAPRRALIGNWVHSHPDDAYPGPERRLAPRDVPVPRPMADGRGQRRHGRAGTRRLPPRVGRPGTVPGDVARGVDRRGGLAASGPRGVASSSLRQGTCRWSAASIDGPVAGRGRDLPAPSDDGTRAALSWGAGRAPNGLARDLRSTMRRSDVHVGRPDADLDVIRSPTVVLTWQSPVPVATAVVRLQDVAPDGTPFQVSAGILNLTHRDSHERPAALEPARRRRSGSSCERPPTGSAPVTASGCPSPRRCGRSSGRRPRPLCIGSTSAAAPRPVRPPDRTRRSAGDVRATVQDDEAGIRRSGASGPTRPLGGRR